MTTLAETQLLVLIERQNRDRREAEELVAMIRSLEAYVELMERSKQRAPVSAMRQTSPSNSPLPSRTPFLGSPIAESKKRTEREESAAAALSQKKRGRKRKSAPSVATGKVAAEMTRPGVLMERIPKCLLCIRCKGNRVKKLVQKKDKKGPRSPPPSDGAVHDAYVALTSSVSASAYHDDAIRDFFSCGQCRAHSSALNAAELLDLSNNYFEFCNLCKLEPLPEVSERLQSLCSLASPQVEHTAGVSSASSELNEELPVVIDEFTATRIRGVLHQLGTHRFVVTHRAVMGLIQPRDPSVDAPSETQPLIQAEWNGQKYVIGFEWKAEKEWDDQDHTFWLCFYDSDPGIAGCQWIRFDRDVLPLMEPDRRQPICNDLADLAKAYIEGGMFDCNN